MSDIRVFMNLGQHSEAAAKRPLNELRSPGQPAVLCTIYIPKATSYVWHDWSWGPAHNGLQDQTIPASSNNSFWSSPGFTLWWERLCVFSEPKPRWMPPPRSPRLCPLQESCIPFPVPLTLSHWLHPAHFNLIFLPHVPRPSVHESVQILPWLRLVWKLGTSPKDQNRQGRGKDHKVTGSQAKHKSCEYNICTRTNIWFPLCTWAGPSLLLPRREAGALALYRKPHCNKDLQEA